MGGGGGVVQWVLPRRSKPKSDIRKCTVVRKILSNHGSGPSKAETQNNINSEKSVILAGGRNSQKP